MIYLIIGPSCAGKTYFTINSFCQKIEKVYKDIVYLTETKENILFGRYDLEKRAKGTDNIARSDIPKIFDQIKKILLDKPNKNIILEGDKICSHKLFEKIKDLNIPCKLFWVKCSPQKSYERNLKNGSTCKFDHLKGVYTKSLNLYYDFEKTFNGEIIDTEHIIDFCNLSIKNKMQIQKTENNDNFAVFILTARRPDNIKTLKALKKSGYTGKTYLLVDDDDPTANEYKKNFGDMVILLDKKKAIKMTDSADNFDNRKGIIYARNYAFVIAKQFGLKYFLELDDDYTNFGIRYNKDNVLKETQIRNFDYIVEIMIKFLKKSNAKTVAFAQGGDFIGGVSNFFKKGIARKAMNSFFCKTENQFLFRGRINEDVNTYTYLGSVGELFFTITNLSLNQEQTQKSSGGMTEIYLDSGTYVKSFYSVMFMPSCVKISVMGNHNMRLHHKISWNNCVPKILHEKFKKV